jgi:hypothetical protein
MGLRKLRPSKRKNQRSHKQDRASPKPDPRDGETQNAAAIGHHGGARPDFSSYCLLARTSG